MYGFNKVFETDGITTGKRFLTAKSSESRIFVQDAPGVFCNCMCVANDECVGVFEWVANDNVTRCTGLRDLGVADGQDVLDNFKLTNQNTSSYLKVLLPSETPQQSQDCFQLLPTTPAPDPCELSTIQARTFGDPACDAWFETGTFDSAQSGASLINSLWCRCLLPYIIQGRIQPLQCDALPYLNASFSPGTASVSSAAVLDQCGTTTTTETITTTIPEFFSFPFGEEIIQANISKGVLQPTWFNLTAEILARDPFSTFPEFVQWITYTNLPEGIRQEDLLHGELSGVATRSGIYPVSISAASAKGTIIQAQMGINVLDCGPESCQAGYVCADNDLFDNGDLLCDCVTNCTTTTLVPLETGRELTGETLALLISVAVVAFILILMVVIIVYIRMKANQKSKIDAAMESTMFNHVMSLEPLSPLELEVPRNQLWLGDVLSAGFFGQLRDGRLIVDESTASKTTGASKRRQSNSNNPGAALSQDEINTLTQELVEIFMEACLNSAGMNNTASRDQLLPLLRKCDALQSIRVSKDMDPAFTAERILGMSGLDAIEQGRVNLNQQEFIDIVFKHINDENRSKLTATPAGETERVLAKCLDTATIFNAFHSNPTINLPDDLEDVIEQEFLELVGMYASFDHHNVAKIMGVLTKEDPCVILFESSEYGDLHSFLTRARIQEQNNITGDDHEFTGRHQFKFCMDITQGLWYLAGKRFVHGNLMAANIVVADNWKLKIADVGMDPHAATDCFHLYQVLATDAHANNAMSYDPVRWMAVECLQHQTNGDGKFSTFSDIWSLAVVFYEIFSRGAVPYEKETTTEGVKALVQRGRRLERPTKMPPPLYNCCLSCWNPTAAQRPVHTDIIMALNRLMWGDIGGLLPVPIPQEGNSKDKKKKDSLILFPGGMDGDDDESGDNEVMTPLGMGKKKKARKQTDWSGPKPSKVRFEDDNIGSEDFMMTDQREEEELGLTREVHRAARKKISMWWAKAVEEGVNESKPFSAENLQETILA